MNDDNLLFMDEIRLKKAESQRAAFHAQTIAAIATPLAPAGLGVIRLSGDRALEIGDRVFRAKNAKKTLTVMPGYTACFGHVFDAEGDIDECVATVFRAPHSYTGETVLELSCHGGVYLLQRVLRAVYDAGARPAEAGEFTRRAFMNGKMDLTAAESVMSLISAQSRLAAKTALASCEGAVFQRLSVIRDSLIEILSQLSAYVDYPDEDIPQLTVPELQKILAQADNELNNLLSTFDSGRVLREGIDTVIVGSPNVGKSTLMNAFTGYDSSIVTSQAGTTRDVVEETVRLGEVTLKLADTAGIHDTDDLVEAIGVDRARQRMQSASLILAVFDGSRKLNTEDLQFAEQASQLGAIAVINKADRPLKINKEYIKEKFQHSVVISAAAKRGMQELTDLIAHITGVEQLQPDQPLLATERQRNCARYSLIAIREAQTALQQGLTLDAVAVSLDDALSAILELTGERVTEKVVDEIFSRFCVGK